MGLLISKLMDVFESFSSDPPRILLMGLDGAGKTTILYRMKLNKCVITIATIGFNIETVTPTRGITFKVWDLTGTSGLRTLWHQLYPNTHGLIFVVDGLDRERIDEARAVLEDVLSSSVLQGVPLCVFANKQDLPGAMNSSEVTNMLNLQKIRGRKWLVQETCAQTGKGLAEGCVELARYIKEFKAGHR